MFKILKAFILFILLFTALAGCNSGGDKKEIHFEVLNGSLYPGPKDYDTKFGRWKKIYEECMQYPLFENALYMGLQENVHIGSISNQNATNINEKFSIFDSSNRKNIRNLFTLVKESNCYSKISPGKDLQKAFYGELIKGLKNSGEYQYLAESIDTTRMNFKITNLADNAIRPDSLVSLLQRSKDSPLLQFKQMLVTPGNALLVRTAMILGFYCEFPMKRKFSPDEETKFKNEVFFKIGNAGDNGSIKLLPNQNVQILINKYYTLFGQFCVFKEINKG